MVAHAKCNVGPLQKSRELTLTAWPLNPFDPHPIITSRIEIGDQCDVSADDLVRDRDRRQSPKVQAERFLRQLLSDGAHRASEVMDLAEDADISIRTLRRAKKDLGVDSFKRLDEWWWVLSDALPDEQALADNDEE